MACSVGPWTEKDLRVVHSDSQMSVFTSGCTSSILYCTAAASMRRRKPVLKRGPALEKGERDHTQVGHPHPPTSRGYQGRAHAYQRGPSSTAVFPGMLPWQLQGSCLYRLSRNRQIRRAGVTTFNLCQDSQWVKPEEPAAGRRIEACDMGVGRMDR